MSSKNSMLINAKKSANSILKKVCSLLGSLSHTSRCKNKIIIDMLGKTQTFTISAHNKYDVSSLASGVYLLKVSGLPSVKFTKQ